MFERGVERKSDPLELEPEGPASPPLEGRIVLILGPYEFRWCESRKSRVRWFRQTLTFRVSSLSISQALRPMLPILSPFLLARYDCERESFAKEGMRDTLYPSQRGLQNQKNDRKRKIEKNVDREKGGESLRFVCRGRVML